MSSDQEFRQIAQVIASADGRITGVHLFGSQAKNLAKPDPQYQPDHHDTDIAILVRSDQSPGVYNVKGPIGQRVRQALRDSGYQVGKGAGCVDFDLARDAIQSLPPEQQGIIGRAFLSGRKLWP